MDFCMFLFRVGRIDALQAIAALDKQMCRRVPIGRLAMEHGLLSAMQVMDVLRTQSGDGEGELFGQIAVELGFINRDELNVLLGFQRRRVPEIEGVLLEMGLVTADELPALRERFARALAA